jgi:hypothetical protein
MSRPWMLFSDVSGAERRDQMKAKPLDTRKWLAYIRLVLVDSL